MDTSKELLKLTTSILNINNSINENIDFMYSGLNKKFELRLIDHKSNRIIKTKTIETDNKIDIGNLILEVKNLNKARKTKYIEHEEKIKYVFLNLFVHFRGHFLLYQGKTNILTFIGLSQEKSTFYNINLSDEKDIYKFSKMLDVTIINNTSLHQIKHTIKND